MNLNEFARRVTLEEGGKISISIAQVKEVMRIVFRMLARMPPSQVSRILRRFEGW